MKLGFTFVLFFLVACGGSGGGGTTTPEVSISPENVESLVVGGTQLFEANATPASEMSFSWSASGGDIVVQSDASQAEYTAPSAPGDYTISVSTGAGATDQISLSVLEADEDLVANADPTVALESGVLAAGAVQEYIIAVPESLNQGLIYIELESDDALTLEAGGYFSNDPTFFSDENPSAPEEEAILDEGLDTQTLDTQTLDTQTLDTQTLDTQGLDAARACRGPCIILNNAAASYPVTITNTGEGEASFSLYAYEATFSDSGEPANDEVNCGVDLGDLEPIAIPVTPDAADGAIETIGDVDCFADNSEDRVSIIFSAAENLSVPLAFEVFSQTDPGDPPTQLEIRPGEASTISDCGITEGVDGVIIAVRAIGDVAGPSVNTNYAIEFSDTVPADICGGD